MIMILLIINGLASVETEDIFTPADSRTRKNHSVKFKHLQANLGTFSFFPPSKNFRHFYSFDLKIDHLYYFKNTQFSWLRSSTKMLHFGCILL